jgi:hypothetical protein
MKVHYYNEKTESKAVFRFAFFLYLLSNTPASSLMPQESYYIILCKNSTKKASRKRGENVEKKQKKYQKNV